MVNKKRTKKCAICNNPNVCINYRDSFICEDCLGYITDLSRFISTILKNLTIFNVIWQN